MKEAIMVFITGVFLGTLLVILMIIFITPSPNEIGCNFVGKTLDIRTVLIDNSVCLIETESGFITLQDYIGE